MQGQQVAQERLEAFRQPQTGRNTVRLVGPAAWLRPTRRSVPAILHAGAAFLWPRKGQIQGRVSGAATGYPQIQAPHCGGRAALGRLPGHTKARAKRKGRQARPEPHG